jgi:hypothetical protein
LAIAAVPRTPVVLSPRLDALKLHGVAIAVTHVHVPLCHVVSRCQIAVIRRHER